MEEQVRQLTSLADVLIFGSSCEACSFILLDYLSSGRPIVCSDYPTMMELAGDAALYVDPLSPQAWKRAMLETLAGGEPVRRRAERAVARARCFSWEECAARTFEALTQW